ncbi:hypothetical protein PM082_012355 [Marasmius tenuissimus]|nr:hypothetical protein PM082_012355 [Marasmius tenuissimus]
MDVVSCGFLGDNIRKIVSGSLRESTSDVLTGITGCVIDTPPGTSLTSTPAAPALARPAFVAALRPCHLHPFKSYKQRFIALVRYRGRHGNGLCHYPIANLPLLPLPFITRNLARFQRSNVRAAYAKTSEHGNPQPTLKCPEGFGKELATPIRLEVNSFTNTLISRCRANRSPTLVVLGITIDSAPHNTSSIARPLSGFTLNQLSCAPMSNLSTRLHISFSRG